MFAPLSNLLRLLKTVLSSIFLVLFRAGKSSILGPAWGSLPSILPSTARQLHALIFLPAWFQQLSILQNCTASGSKPSSLLRSVCSFPPAPLILLTSPIPFIT